MKLPFRSIWRRIGPPPPPPPRKKFTRSLVYFKQREKKTGALPPDEIDKALSISWGGGTAFPGESLSESLIGSRVLWCGWVGSFWTGAREGDSGFSSHTNPPPPGGALNLASLSIKRRRNGSKYLVLMWQDWGGQRSW